MLIPIVATMVGALLSSFVDLSPRARSWTLHFTAGVVFAALAGEVMPDVMERHQPAATVIGFVAGVVLMFGISRVTESLEERGEVVAAQRFPTALVAAISVDTLIDGLLIGIGFAVGGTLGTLITVALSLEMFFLGITTVATLRSTGSAPVKAIAVTSIAAAMIAVGAVLGVTVFSQLPAAGVAGLLAFGAAALLYLVTEELLAEAHEVPDTQVMGLLFFGGFLTLLIIEMTL
jgi:zinc transporter, ZIP family